MHLWCKNLPDIGEATKKATDPEAKQSPKDFSIRCTPKRSTKITGNKAAQHPEK